MRELGGDVTPADVDGDVGGRVTADRDASQRARLVLRVDEVAARGRHRQRGRRAVQLGDRDRQQRGPGPPGGRRQRGRRAVQLGDRDRQQRGPGPPGGRQQRGRRAAQLGDQGQRQR